jgi:hypothetical protein
MALKFVQEIEHLEITNTGFTTSTSIALQTGYLRISTNVDCHVAIGTNPEASTSSFFIAQGKSEILKEKVARQKISGITTGSSTSINFGQNYGNPFVVGDCLTIQNAYPSGINTTHNLITAILENPNTGESTIVIDFDSTSITGVAVTNATAAKSIKVSGLACGSITGMVYISEVQIASQA